MWVSPPEPAKLIADALPAGSAADPFAAAFAEGLVKSFTDTIGLHLAPSLGLALAAAGAGAALAGALSRSR